MSSLDALFKKVQMLEEAKSAGYAKQAPVFKDVPKKMKAAGLAASSRDAMIFITQVLSRLDIIEPNVYEMAIKGQHKERMEKLMAILRAKEEEINAKSDEIVEYINQNLDNYTAGAGTDRNRSEKYKETAKAMSQEVQNIKAGKEADDALRDIAVTVSQGLDSDVTDEDIAALDFDEADIFINIPDANVKGEVAKKVADYLNGQGLKAEPTRAGVNVEAPTGFFGDNAMHAKFEDQFKGLVMRLDPNIGEDKLQVKFTGSEGPVEVEDYEMEDGEGKYDDHDGEEERCDYVPCEDGEGHHPSGSDDGECDECGGDGCDVCNGTGENEEDGEHDDAFDAQKEKVKAMFDQQILDEVNAKVEKHAGEPGFDHDAEWLAALKSIHSHYKRHEGKDRFAAAERLLAKSDATLAKNVSSEDEEIVAESKYTTADYIDDAYANVKPIEETIVESTTVNENGQTSHTQQYIVEKAEAAIEEVYTNQYLTEQKASDSLLVPKEEKSETFKERYQPKTSYQLEELRRYGL